ncbi:DNA-binding protein [Paenibacillus wynnii]|nr:DNA-binding protein [Paenibacillus wynnii]
MKANMPTIRSEIEKHLTHTGHNLASFAKMSGLNRGSLSAILHGNPPKPISLGQLDAITKAFGFPKGWFYTLYIEECFSENKVSRRRVEPFLIRCAEMGKTQCIDEVLNRILEYPKPLELIFSVAEKLFEQGRVKESIIFYTLVTENESDNYSDRLAISQYRIFKSLDSVVDMEEQLRAVITFEPFRGRLAENMALDGLLTLANVSFTLHKWKAVEKYADELRALAHGIYREELSRRRNGRRTEPLDLLKPLVLYYGHGYLLKAVALTKQGNYEDAKKYTAGYADLSWFELLDDESARVEVDNFRRFAEANTYTLELLSGNVGILPRYIDFLNAHPNEILPGLITIMHSANRYGNSVEGILTRFSREMLRFERFEDPINVDRRFRLNYQLAMYFINKEKYEKGIDYVIQCIKTSMAMNNGKGLLQCITLLEMNRDQASVKQLSEFQMLMKEVRINEKNAVDDDRRFGIV